MKILTMEISKCYECPKLEASDNKNSFFCGLARKELIDFKLHIPDWCPLPEKDED